MSTISYPYDSPVPYDSSNPYDTAPPVPTTGAIQVQSGAAAEYRFFLADILTNTVIAEVPFTNVTYENALSRAGAFSGEIPVIAVTKGLNLYESTLPGKTALYILRNSVCVWGGIIWARQYSPVTKTLKVDGNEFLSYFFHRAVWQTLYYGTPNIQCSKYEADGSHATIYTSEEHGFLVGEMVRIRNLNTPLNIDAVIVSTPTPASFTFASSAVLALSSSDTGLARIVLDSYETTRQIISWLLVDFEGLGFANDIDKPASESEYSIIGKSSTPISGSSPAASLYTLETSTPHSLVAGQEVEVVSVDSIVDGYRTVVSVATSTTFDVEVSGTHTISHTTLAGMNISNILSRSIEGTTLAATHKSVSGNLATITFGTSHRLVAGDYIAVSEMSNVIAYPSMTTGSSGVFDLTVADPTGIVPGMNVIGGASILLGTVVRSVVGNIVTVNLAPVGTVSEVIVYSQPSTLNGQYVVYSTPTTDSITYAVNTPDLPTTAITAGKVSYKDAVIVTDGSYSLSVGSTVVISDVGIDYDGTYTVAYINGPNTFSYNVFAVLDQPIEAVWGGTVKTGSRATYNTYGAFANNSNIPIQFDSTTTTKVIGYDQQIFRGSDLKMFGEILDEFAKDINGFEYRIDCDYVGEEFLKTFTFVPYYVPPSKVVITSKELVATVATLTTETDHNLSVGQHVVVEDVGAAFNGTQIVTGIPNSTTFTFTSYGYNNVPTTSVTGYIGLVHPLNVLGADQLIFEYPGNITSFDLVENAETSATRMWVTGNNNGLDGAASQPYAGASDMGLLNDGWPILDQVENKSDNLTAALGQQALYNYAKDYLDESRPPDGVFTVSVNGSLDPQIGDYKPGEWCSVIFDDDFVRERLAHSLEPRSDVIVRKIAGVKVSVPNSVSFPEQVTLELIPEWREDRRNAK